MTPTPPPQLIGRYRTPRVRKGELVLCLYRDVWCRVTAFTHAPIPWPKVRPDGQSGHAWVWVNDEMERAIRTESVVALMHWFGVGEFPAYKWRVWAGVSGQMTTPGSRAATIARAVFGGRSQRLWTADEDALLGTDTDRAVGKRVGRSKDAVRVRRYELGIPQFKGK